MLDQSLQLKTERRAAHPGGLRIIKLEYFILIMSQYVKYNYLRDIDVGGRVTYSPRDKDQESASTDVSFSHYPLLCI